MFDLRTWQNPDTLMLDVMNTILGLAIVLAAAAIGWKAIRDQRHENKESHPEGH